MKGKVLAFVLAAAVAAFAQGRSGGHAGGMAGGVDHSMGNSMDHGHSSMGPSTNSSTHGSGTHMQQPLKQAQIDGGAFRMLEKRTGMTQQQLQQLYASSGARNFGQFVSAIVVSRNLGLNTNTLLTDLKTMSLGKALQSMGVSSHDSKAAIKKANEEIKEANRHPETESTS